MLKRTYFVLQLFYTPLRRTFVEVVFGLCLQGSNEGRGGAFVSQLFYYPLRRTLMGGVGSCLVMVSTCCNLITQPKEGEK